MRPMFVLVLVACADAPVGTTSLDPVERVAPPTDEPALDEGQCRMIATPEAGPQLTDTDNTSCGVIVGPIPGVGSNHWPGLAPGFVATPVHVVNARTDVRRLDGPNGSLLLLDGADLLQVDAEGEEGVIATGTWSPLGMAPSDGAVVVFTPDGALAIRGPF